MTEILDVTHYNTGAMMECVVALTAMFQPYLRGPIAVYIGWIMIHYLAAHAYSTYCVNWSWYGFIASPFLSTTPVCRGISWVIYEGSNTMAHLWVMVGTTLSLYMTTNARRRDE